MRSQALPGARRLVGVGAAGQSPDPHTGTNASARTVPGRILTEWEGRCARVQVSGEVLGGPPTAELIAAAAGADLIVAGARRHDGERHGVRIGPVAGALLRQAACPVVIVPHF